MIFDPDIATIRKMPFVVLMAIVIFGISGPFEIPGYWYIYALSGIAWFIYSIYLTAACTSYVTFAVTQLAMGLTMLGMVFWRGLHFTLQDLLGERPLINLPLSLVPVTLCYLAIWTFWRQPGPPPGLSINDGRVVYFPPIKRGRGYYPLGLLMGFAMFIFHMLAKLIGEVAVGAIAGIGGWIFFGLLLFYGRHHIGVAGHVFRLQKKTGVAFTFWRIDEIEQMRSKWWLSRTVRYLTRH